jgi:hypothetical protein
MDRATCRAAATGSFGIGTRRSLRIAAAVSSARAVSDSFFGLSVIMESSRWTPMGAPPPTRAPQGRTQLEHEELLVAGRHPRSSKVDVRTDGLAEPAVFQVRWTVGAIAVRFGRAIHALNRSEAKRLD